MGTVGHAQAAGGGVKKRLKPSRGVLVASSYVIKRLITKGRIPHASGQAEQSIRTLRGVAARIAAVRGGGNCLRRRRKRKAAERQRDEKKTAPQRRLAD